MLQRLPALLAFAILAHADTAMIRGVVLESMTGSPLVRSLITIDPVPGTGGAPRTLRTSRYGGFEATNLPPGMYIVTASRAGFLTAQYGQRRWNSAGLPVILGEGQTAFLDIRLQRYGAITGTVSDEQEVGLQGLEVVAYHLASLPQLIGLGATDDHGRYRIGGLTPGTYVVRTKPKQLDGVDYIPTFGKEGARLDEGQRVEVDLDRASSGANVRPALGKLLRVGGIVTKIFKGPIKLTFVSDLGRVTISTVSTFEFPPVPPGNYEIFAEGPGDANAVMEGLYMPLNMDHDRTDINVITLPIQKTLVSLVKGGNTKADVTAKYLFRSIDLAGVSEPAVLPVTDNRAQLAPGRWELMALPASGYYVSGFGGTRPLRPGGANTRPDGWNEITVNGRASATFVVSPNPATVRGTVKFSGDPMPAAPVYLEPYDTAKRERLWTPRVGRADTRGQFEISGLAPGTYRILSTFEFLNPDAQIFDNAVARLITVEEGRAMQCDVDLWGIR